ncbi:CBS domain-containing protein [Chloropicon primus]|uniref:CBS domain-containing protein n=2 Tax=Chloropicon primus TaxID=1764295 RepID=A0A5B8MHY1_9CHLO|nr:hypothetical protein A3770_03p25770 [Chloropicon primus]UPQ99271.1 CBS domain-containing protein [Chloropicon primus]|eukprot:QDZ20059.1 hypothetical protein A3770_03p25770 [Chloropicon primus]
MMRAVGRARDRRLLASSVGGVAVSRGAKCASWRTNGSRPARGLVRSGTPAVRTTATRGLDGFPLEEDFPMKQRQVAPLLYVRQVMSKDVVCLQEECTLRDALELFLLKRVSGAPVVNSKGKLVGVLSMTDIIWVESTEALSVLPFYPGDSTSSADDDRDMFGADSSFDFLSLKVSRRMSRKVFECKPDELLDKAAALMIANSINRIPVTNSAREVVGIVTRLDIMRCLAAIAL